MKRLVFFSMLCLICEPYLGADTPALQKPQNETSVLKIFSKSSLGVASTAGFAFALYTWYQDYIGVTKRYSRAGVGADFYWDNRYRISSDVFTSLGLAYLTYKSGLFTLESMKELFSSDDTEENKQSVLS